MSANASLADLASLQARAKSIRKDIIISTTTAGSGHPTSSLSAVEILVSLYFGGVLRYDARNPDWPQRDRFILSKGHAAPVLYAVLAEAGYFARELLPTLRKIGSPLEGHPNKRRLPGIEASTGSLGQGLSVGVGQALAARLDGHDSRIYVLLGKTRCHGIGLTPDEKEVWVVDQGNKEMHIFDNTVMPPKFKLAVPMAANVHGWICFSRDGKYGWCDTGEVFDVATKKVVAQWTDKPDGQGGPVMSSKFFEVHFQGDDAVWVGQQMGIGYVGVK